MAVTDPRERHDGLLVRRDDERVGPETFAERRAVEAYRSGWVAGGAAFDDAGRVLLAYDADDGEWLLPGGAVQQGEDLHGALVRELREETGVTVVPDCPVGVTDVVTRCDGATAGFTVAFFAATAETTATGDDLGEDDEAITDARWFGSLPAALYQRAWVERLLAACPRWER